MSQRAVGVDVGGTKVSVAVLVDGALGEPVVHATDHGSEAALLDQLAACVREHDPVDAVGVGVPSVIDYATGAVRFSPNIPLVDVPLREELGDRLGVPVVVENDASCAALAEALDDDGDPIASPLVLVTVGTGVGGGIVVDGALLRGATGSAAEIGHMLVAADLTDGAPAAGERFPQPGALEAHAAGRALDRLAAERGLPEGRELVELARAGDDDAREALRVLGERLGVGLANLINIFDPELVLVGGGVSAAGDLLLEPAREAAQRFVLPGVGTKTRIDIARHGPEAGVRGAALLARQELEARATTRGGPPA